jgi:CBS domain-containing protein
VVSKTDLVHHQRSGDRRTPRSDYFRFPENEGLPAGFHFESPDRSRVKEIMTQAVIAAEESTPVAKIADAMLANHVHRVLVTRRGKLKGIITAMDLLRVFGDGKRRR